MTCFRHFTTPLWEIFIGNLLLLFCSLFYLAWWIVSCRPDSPGRSALGGFYIISAFITGIAAVVLLSLGFFSLSFELNDSPVLFILIGGVVLFFILLVLTSLVFHRQVTTELAIMHIWVVLELSAVAVLYGTGRLGPGRMVTLTILIGIAFVVGMICYMLHYQLEPRAGYRNGMIPLATDALVMAVFLVLSAL